MNHPSEIPVVLGLVLTLAACSSTRSDDGGHADAGTDAGADAETEGDADADVEGDADLERDADAEDDAEGESDADTDRDPDLDVDDDPGRCSLHLAWGFPGAQVVPGDYDGDGRDDLAVYDAATGSWYIETIETEVLAWEYRHGYTGTVAVPGDYDGDGRDDLAVYDAATGSWYIITIDGLVLAYPRRHGYAGTVQVPGDYDGNGSDDLAVYDIDTANWYVIDLAGAPILWGRQHGYRGALPVAGDLDGDGRDDLTVYDEAQGLWYGISVAGAPLIWGERYSGRDLFPAAGTIRTMTYNLGATTTSLYGDPTAVMDALAAAIVEFQADVFCATDLERNTARHSRRDMPALLAASLIARGYPMENRWHTRFGVDGGENGYVVFSRSPMEDYRVWDLPDANPWMETMPVQSFQLTVGTDRLRFFNLHPAPGWDDDGFYPCRSIDPAVFDIVDDFASSSVFLLGDFNIPINLTPGYCYEDLVARYTDACVPERDSSCDSTVAVDIVGGEPNTIDHIFFDFAGDTAHTWRLARTHVDQDANDEIVISDHYPVFAEFDYGAKEHVLLGDYDGDGRDQLVVHAPQSDGDIDWYVRGSTPFDWGFVGTRPVGGDFDGDGIDDPVVFEPATGSWYLLLRVCP